MTQKKMKLLESNMLKVCNSLNPMFLEKLNCAVLKHSSITSKIFISIIKELSKEKISSIYDLASLIGFNIEVGEVKENFLFELEYINNKILLKIAHNTSVYERNKIFSLALSDILCNYTSGMSEKLYSAYVRFYDIVNVDIFHHPSLSVVEQEINSALIKIIIEPPYAQSAS